MNKLALYLLAATALLGCGSDDSNPTPTPTPTPTVKLTSGFYTGTDSESEVLDGLVDDEGKLWVTYIEVDSMSGDEEAIGFVKSNNPVLLSNSKFKIPAKNYSFDNRPSRDIEVTGDYQAGTINGKLIELPSNQISYELKLDTLSFKKHTFNHINNKTFTGPLYVTGGINNTAKITFTTNGNFTGSDSKGCNMTGKFTPAASERYYVSTVTFSQISCAAAGETLTGNAILDDDDKNLLLRAANGSGSIGMSFGE